MREKQPRLLVLWGKYDLSFELSEPEAYRRDVPKAEVHVLDAGHFALDTAADQIFAARAELHEIARSARSGDRFAAAMSAHRSAIRVREDVP